MELIEYENCPLNEIDADVELFDPMIVVFENGTLLVLSDSIEPNQRG